MGHYETVLTEYHYLVDKGCKPIGFVYLFGDNINEDMLSRVAAESRENSIFFRVKALKGEMVGFARNQTMLNLFKQFHELQEYANIPSDKTDRQAFFSTIEGLFLGYGVDEIHRFVTEKVYGERVYDSSVKR